MRKGGVATQFGIEPEPVGDGERQLDDVAAVAPGVGVVRLDHVTEQERRPAVGVRELERVVDPALTLPRKDREEA